MTMAGEELVPGSIICLAADLPLQLLQLGQHLQALRHSRKRKCPSAGTPLYLSYVLMQVSRGKHRVY